MDRCKVIDGYILVHKTSCEFVSLTRLNKAFCTGYDGVAVCRETTRIIPHFNAFFLNMALILLADVSKRKEALKKAQVAPPSEQWTPDFFGFSSERACKLVHDLKAPSLKGLIRNG